MEAHEVLALITEILQRNPAQEIRDVSYDGDNNSAEIFFKTKAEDGTVQEWVIRSKDIEEVTE